MGGFNENRDAMLAQQQMAGLQQLQGMAGLQGQQASLDQWPLGSIGSSADLYMQERERERAAEMHYMTEEQDRARHESEMRQEEAAYYKSKSRSEAEYREMMRISVDPSYEGVHIEHAARANLKKNARDIDKAESVREFLQAETDDWLEDALKVN